MTTSQWLKDARAQSAKDKAEVEALKEALRPRPLGDANTSFWDGICLLLKKAA